MRILVITGLPGTGKTTLADLLAQRYNTPVIGKDLIKEPLLNAISNSSNTAHSRLLSDASFAVLFAVARQLLAAGKDMILEGNFRPGEHEGSFRALLTKNVSPDNKVQLMQLLCRIEEPTRLARLAARQKDPTRHAGHQDRSSEVMANRCSDDFLDLPGERFIFDEAALTKKKIEQLDQWWQQTHLTETSLK